MALSPHDLKVNPRPKRLEVTAAVKLVTEEGVSVAEAARRMGVPRVTVYQRLQREGVGRAQEKKAKKPVKQWIEDLEPADTPAERQKVRVEREQYEALAEELGWEYERPKKKKPEGNPKNKKPFDKSKRPLYLEPWKISVGEDIAWDPTHGMSRGQPGATVARAKVLDIKYIDYKGRPATPPTAREVHEGHGQGRGHPIGGRWTLTHDKAHIDGGEIVFWDGSGWYIVQDGMSPGPEVPFDRYPIDIWVHRPGAKKSTRRSVARRKSPKSVIAKFLRGL